MCEKVDCLNVVQSEQKVSGNYAKSSRNVVVDSCRKVVKSIRPVVESVLKMVEKLSVIKELSNKYPNSI